MDEIFKLNNQLIRQRKRSTIFVGGLLVLGFMASIPLFTDTIKHDETIFCSAKSVGRLRRLEGTLQDNIKTECRGSSIKRGISYLIDKERRNQLFDNNIRVVKLLPPEDNTAVYFGLISSLFMLSAYSISKLLTNTQEKAIHSQFKLLKIKALENDLLEQTHIDLFTFSKNNQAEITKQAIAGQTSETIQAMKSEAELQLDHLNGQLQGELSLKNHELEITQLSKQIAENILSELEIKRKIDKLNKPMQDSKQTTADEQAKQGLVEALKSHEDGYLWKIINSLKPLWLIGNQGSGKTYTAAAIALIRKYCLDAPIHQLIDRHATGDNADVWKLLKAASSSESEDEISTAFDECCDRWLNRIKQKPTTKQQVIVDEFTNLKSLCGDTAIAFFKMSLTDTRKAKEYLLGITHNATNESFPDGTAAARKSGTTLLEKFSANGETPLSRVVVRYGLVDEQGNSLEDVERTLPSWFHPRLIYEHFNGKLIDF